MEWSMSTDKQLHATNYRTDKVETVDVRLNKPR